MNWRWAFSGKPESGSVWSMVDVTGNNRFGGVVLSQFEGVVVSVRLACGRSRMSQGGIVLLHLMRGSKQGVEVARTGVPRL